MSRDRRDFKDVLKDAQKKGFAELDPTFDIQGVDAGHKISILSSLAFNIQIDFKGTYIEGISKIDASDFEFAKEILMNFCKDVFYFGPVGMGAKAKLVNNFLSLGTATFVIETLKAADKLGIDLNKLYDVAKLGSGNSGALNRMAEKAINNDYKGYIFSVNNTVKDLTYINELLKGMPNAEKLSSVTKSFYEEAKSKGYGDLLISELIKK